MKAQISSARKRHDTADGPPRTAEPPQITWTWRPRADGEERGDGAARMVHRPDTTDLILELNAEDFFFSVTFPEVYVKELKAFIEKEFQA